MIHSALRSLFPYIRIENYRSQYRQNCNYTIMIIKEQVAFLEILTFIAGGLLFVGVGSWVGSLLQPKHPDTEKLQTYESGEEPTGSAWSKFNTRFHIIAIVFALFEVETILLFPWATVWANPVLNEVTGGLWASYTAISTTLFIILLTVGLVYVWSQGHLMSPPPPLSPSSFASHVPKTLYDRVNRRYAPSNTTNQTS